MVYNPQPWADNDTTKPVSAARMAYMESGIQAAHQIAASGGGVGIGEVLIDSLSSGTDDDMLLAAKAHHTASLPYSPVYRMTNRKYKFTQSFGNPPNGFSLKGSGWNQMSLVSTVHPAYHTTVQLEIPRAGAGLPGYWIDAVNGVKDFNIGNFNAYSDNGFTQMFRAPLSGGGFSESSFHNIVAQNFYSVFGNASEGCAMTICDVSGPGWQIMECRSQGVTIQGSDCGWIFGDGLDWYQSDAVAVGNAQWMGEFRSLGKSNIGPIYVTAHGTWRGVKFTGGVSVGGIIMTGAKIEGNNADQPCIGSLLRIEGGSVGIRDTTIDDGMFNPAATASANGGTADRGLVEVLGTARCYIDGLHVAHANGVAITTPVIYASGSATLRVRNVIPFSRGPAWGTQLPVVKQSVAGIIKDSDTSIALSVG
jgi:hypothetical protein